jgi:CSLREA domain-containing protein
MTNTKTTTTTKVSHYFTALVALALMASLLVAAVARPSYAAPSTFIVNLTADTPDANLSNAVCDVNPTVSGNQCTLRAAIQEANDNNNPTEQDLINFNIPDSVDPGVKTISPTSNLPNIEEPVIIDGYSQPGSSVNTLAKATNAKLLIELNGNNTLSRGLNVLASDSVVKGLVINRFSGIGIEIAPFGDLVTNVKVEGNFIGTNAAGTSALANDVGVDLFATANSTVGGTSRATRNLISGNEFEGIFIEGGGPFGQGSADNNLIQGNLIGTKKDGIQPLGNVVGVALLFDAEGNRILSNTIFSNSALGIDLGVDGRTANDSSDTDTGTNRLQNFPVITSAKTISGTTTIAGTLNSRPFELYTIQFFSSPSGDEGQTFIGQKVVSTDSSGNATFSFTPTTAVTVGRQITATTTRQATGDTSEFSAAQPVASS